MFTFKRFPNGAVQISHGADWSVSGTDVEAVVKSASTYVFQFNHDPNTLAIGAAWLRDSDAFRALRSLNIPTPEQP